MKTFFKKMEYGNWSAETATFQYKTALSEANVKKNRMKSTIWTYHKDRSQATTLFF